MKKKKKVSFPGCIGHLASGQTTSRLLIHPKEENSSNLSSSSSSSSCSYTNTARMFVSFLVFASLLSSLSTGIVIPSNAIQANQTLRAADDLRKLRKVHHLLRKINKPSTKTIQACVLLWLPSSLFVVAYFRPSWKSRIHQKDPTATSRRQSIAFSDERYSTTASLMFHTRQDEN
ncbi:hypothetical protein SAY87_027107 [Trapa incisa]|uniref:Transmembrane protein n=1 Tax=Trapa incisa TaxID=236973 RepID=A0AAN7GYT4_9MYRT|nr:hypothetical protein SAY87_027107 [Trapa incisa]